MSWQDISPESRGAKRADVSMCVSAGVGAQRRRVTITFRDKEMLAMKWLAHGQSARIMIGRSEHEGRLRIVPGDGATLFSIGVKAAQGDQVCIRSGTLAAALPLRPGAIAAQGVGYDFGDDWIEIDLPGWAKPASPHGAPRLSDLSVPPSPPRKAEPYRGLLADTPAPISRAAGGPIR